MKPLIHARLSFVIFACLAIQLARCDWEAVGPDLVGILVPFFVVFAVFICITCIVWRLFWKHWVKPNQNVMTTVHYSTNAQQGIVTHQQTVQQTYLHQSPNLPFHQSPNTSDPPTNEPTVRFAAYQPPAYDASSEQHPPNLESSKNPSDAFHNIYSNKTAAPPSYY